MRWVVQVMYRSHLGNLDDHITGWESVIEEVEADREEEARVIALCRNQWPCARVAASWPASDPPQMVAV